MGIFFGLWAEAMAAWQWWNFAWSQRPVGKDVVRLNMDETSVCLFPGNAKGTVWAGKRKRRSGFPEAAQKVGRSTRRTCLTHVAFICDRPSWQALLPQVIIGNSHTFALRDWPQLLQDAPGNVYLARRKSAWNNSELLVQIIQLLGAALRPHLGAAQPMLLLDACRLHFNEAVLQACLKQGIWPILVPAKLTWLLQPCDTHVFQSYKAYLKAAYHRARALTADGQLTVPQFLKVLYETMRVKLNGDWALAFDRDGFGPDQSGLSLYAQRRLGLGGPPVAPRSRPSVEQVQLCFPKRAAVPIATLMQPFQPALAVKAQGQRLAPRRPGALGGPAALGGLAAPKAAVPASSAAPAASAAAVASGVGPQTRAQSRLLAALAKGRPLLPPPVSRAAAASRGLGKAPPSLEG